MPWTFYNANGQRLSSAATSINVLDIDGATDIGEDIANGDLLIIDNGAGGTNRKTTVDRIVTYVGANTDTRSGVAKAWCEDDTASGTANASYGVSGVVSGVTGRQVISWSTDFTSVNYAAPAVSHASGALLIQVSTVLVGSMEIFMRNVSEALTDAGYSFAVFGDQ
jgi:hypothetical protein